MILKNQTTNQVLAESILQASRVFDRMKGLIGKQDFPDRQALWISHCPSIHTFFMKFPIDVIFADKNLRITSYFHSIPSGRVIYGGKKSHSVFEMKANQLKNYQLNKGDQLYVGN